MNICAQGVEGGRWRGEPVRSYYDTALPHTLGAHYHTLTATLWGHRQCLLATWVLPLPCIATATHLPPCHNKSTPHPFTDVFPIHGKTSVKIFVWKFIHFWWSEASQSKTFKTNCCDHWTLSLTWKMSKSIEVAMGNTKMETQPCIDFCQSVPTVSTVIVKLSVDMLWGWPD